MWRHSATTFERDFWLKTEKDVGHSEATTKQDLSLVSEEKGVKTFWGYK